MSDKKHPVLDFFKKEKNRLLGFIRKKLSDAGSMDAEDVLQDVVLRLLEKEDEGVGLENIGGYVYQSVKNRIVDIYRSRSSRRQVSLDQDKSDGSWSLAEIMADTRYDTHTETERREIDRRIQMALLELPAPYREIWEATEIEGISFAELSELWNEPMGTLLNRKYRAVRMLREELDDWIQN